MHQDDTEDWRGYKVVVNQEEHGLPQERPPPGWRDTGKSGAFSNEAWTDMRPLSLRKSREEAVAAH